MKRLRLTKQNFGFVVAIAAIAILFVIVAIVDGLLYAIAIVLGLAILILILAKLIPWIESKLPDEKDKS